MAADEKSRLTNTQYQRLKREITSAQGRCEAVSGSESLLGYVDSSVMYSEMAGEMGELIPWITQYMPAPTVRSFM